MGTTNTTAVLSTWTGATSSAYFDDFTLSASTQATAKTTNMLKLQKAEITQVNVYPNPATSSFNVSTPSNNAKIIVTALNGKVIKTVIANTKVTTIESGNWAAGVYLIQVQTEAQTTVKKVVIAK
jgi:ribosomal protein L12E/L44/L45/RPP1/RPP2